MADCGRDEGGSDESRPAEERRLQAKLEAGTITEPEYARLTALRFGEDPGTLSFAGAADLYGLTPEELRAEIQWLERESSSSRER